LPKSLVIRQDTENNLTFYVSKKYKFDVFHHTQSLDKNIPQFIYHSLSISKICCTIK